MMEEKIVVNNSIEYKITNKKRIREYPDPSIQDVESFRKDKNETTRCEKKTSESIKLERDKFFTSKIKRKASFKCDAWREMLNSEPNEFINQMQQIAQSIQKEEDIIDSFQNSLLISYVMAMKSFKSSNNEDKARILENNLERFIKLFSRYVRINKIKI